MIGILKIDLLFRKVSKISTIHKLHNCHFIKKYNKIKTSNDYSHNQIIKI